MFRSLKNNNHCLTLSPEEISTILARHFNIDSDQSVKNTDFDSRDYLLYKENLPSLAQSERLMTDSGEIIFLEIGRIRDRTS